MKIIGNLFALKWSLKYMRIITIVVSVILTSTVLSAQPHDSPIFDPNCYFPTVGKAGEIDTIYGSHSGQQLGNYLMKIPPAKGDKYDRVVFDGLPTNAPFIGAYKTGPTFDLKQLELSAKVNLDFLNSKFIFGHFRDTYHTDCFDSYYNKIYWVDEEGNYDKDRFTQLKSSAHGGIGVMMNQVLTPIVTHFTSDSLLDILTGSNSVWDNPLYYRDSCFVELFVGGRNLKGNTDTVISDSILFLWRTFDTTNKSNSRTICVGDFRGTGRQDVIAGDNFGNLLFFKNDPPFSMQKFKDAIRYDTLFTIWENRQFGYQGGNSSFNNQANAIRAYPKKSWDKSVDYVYQVLTSGTYIDQKNYFLRGGPNFGTKRFLISDAEEVFHTLGYLDPINFPGWGIGRSVDTTADLTGTGRTVVGSGGEFTMYSVLSDAFDEKADIFYHLTFASPSTAGGGACAVVGDGDAIQDFLVGYGGFTFQEDKDNHGWMDVGTVQLLHGSKKIPIHLNPKYSVVPQSSSAFENIRVYPNPFQGRGEIHFTSPTAGDGTLKVRNILGQLVAQYNIEILEGLQSLPLTLSNMSSGVYVITIESPSFFGSTRVSLTK